MLDFYKFIESVTFSIKDHEGQNLKNISDVSFYLFQKLQSIPEMRLAKHRQGPVIDIDGTDPDLLAGTLNFYYEGIPENSLKKFELAIKYYLGEIHIVPKRIYYNTSNLFNTPVMRIEIPKIIPEEGSPELNMANGNARYILSLMNYPEDQTEFGVNELLMKLGYVQSQIRPRIQDRNHIQPEYNPERALKELERIAIFAKERDYDYIVMN